MPVFRYALEHWTPSDYELIVFHRGALSEHHRTMIANLNGASSSNYIPENISVRTMDLNSDAKPEDPELWGQHNIAALPAMILRSPGRPGIQNEIWSGPLNEQNLSKLLDSPLRRRLVQLLRKGQSSVWVLLESGDQAQDSAAENLLSTRLDRLQKTLEIPRVAPADFASTERSNPEAQLRVAFSVLRVPRNEPEEEIFVRMLLSSEDDLHELKGPIAFPVFGRGRILYALVGPGINSETIDEACSFLVGPCSCIVKEENPGFDLLLSAAWDSFVRITTTPEQPLPELVGITSTLPGSNLPPETTATADAANPLNTPLLASLETNPVSDELVIRRVIYLSILLGGLMLLATAALWLGGSWRRENR